MYKVAIVNNTLDVVTYGRGKDTPNYEANTLARLLAGFKVANTPAAMSVQGRRLAAIIHRLRRKGYAIKADRVAVPDHPRTTTAVYYMTADTIKFVRAQAMSDV